MGDTSEYAASFDLVDDDDDGMISAGELKRMMQALGNEVSDEQAATMMRRVDTDGDGLISLEELTAFMRRGG